MSSVLHKYAQNQVTLLMHISPTMFVPNFVVIVSPCACDLFVSKVMKITRYMNVRFWRSFFGAFSVCDDFILKSTTAWLLILSVLYIHSFMQVHNTTFQIKIVFNNVLFSTEVHNPLHAHLLALSHIYIILIGKRKKKGGGAGDPLWCFKTNLQGQTIKHKEKQCQ